MTRLPKPLSLLLAAAICPLFTQCSSLSGTSLASAPLAAPSPETAETADLAVAAPSAADESTTGAAKASAAAAPTPNKPPVETLLIATGTFQGAGQSPESLAMPAQELAAATSEAPGEAISPAGPDAEPAAEKPEETDAQEKAPLRFFSRLAERRASKETESAETSETGALETAAASEDSGKSIFRVAPAPEKSAPAPGRAAPPEEAPRRTLARLAERRDSGAAKPELVAYQAADKPPVEMGLCTWYSIKTNGGTHTASGIPLCDNSLTAAHRTLPFGTRVKVTNLRNGNSEVVTITNRGPFIKGRIIDVSMKAARGLEMVSQGVVPVQLEVLDGETPL